MNSSSPQSWLTSVRTTPVVTGKSVLSVFPNPASDHIRIRLHQVPLSSGNAAIQIYDAAGTCLLLKQATISNGSLQAQLSLFHFTKGNYFVTVTAEQQVYKSSFWVE